MPLKDKMEVLTMQNEAEWRIMNENVQKLEDELLEVCVRWMFVRDVRAKTSATLAVYRIY